MALVWQKIDGGARRMRAAMQVPQTVEPLQCEGQAGQQPDQEQTALLVMADMLKSIAVLGVVEALIFDLPAALGHGVEAAATQATRGEIGEPIGLDDFSIAMVLAITDDAHGVPLQAFPGVEVVRVPDLDAIAALSEL